MTLVEIIGTIAAVLSTGAFLPQAIHVIRSRDTRAISLMMYACAMSGASLWLTYGLMTMQWPIIIANGVAFVFVTAIFAMKLRDVLVAQKAPRPAE